MSIARETGIRNGQRATLKGCLGEGNEDNRGGEEYTWKDVLQRFFGYVRTPSDPSQSENHGMATDVASEDAIPLGPL